MENMDKKVCGECGGSCGGGSCCGMSGHGCHGGKHHLVKMILKIVIVILIFWCGFRLGVIAGSVRGDYGQGNYGWGMMRGYNLNNYSGQAPTTPITLTPAK